MKFFQHIHCLITLFAPSFARACKVILCVDCIHLNFKKLQENFISYQLTIRNPYRFANYASDYIWVLMKTNLGMKTIHKYIACVAVFVATVFMATPINACSGHGGLLGTGNCGTVYICADDLATWLRIADAIVEECGPVVEV